MGYNSIITFYDKLVKYDENKGICKVDLSDYGLNYSEDLYVRELERIKLPKNKAFLLMGVRDVSNDGRLIEQLKGKLYTFYLFKPLENYDRFIYGSIYKISDSYLGEPKYIQTTLSKFDIFSKDIRLNISSSEKLELCEMPKLADIQAGS